MSNTVDFYDYLPASASCRAEQARADEQALCSAHGLCFGSIPPTIGRDLAGQAITTEAGR